MNRLCDVRCFLLLMEFESRCKFYFLGRVCLRLFELEYSGRMIAECLGRYKSLELESYYHCSLSRRCKQLLVVELEYFDNITGVLQD